jgi:hypothetical protein
MLAAIFAPVDRLPTGGLPPTRSRPPAIPPRTFQIFHLPIPTSSPLPAPEQSTIGQKNPDGDRANMLQGDRQQLINLPRTKPLDPPSH